jgi:hypothetical protein
MTKRIKLDSLADRGNDQNAHLSVKRVIFSLLNPGAGPLVRWSAT